MPTDLAFSCKCGALGGTLHDVAPGQQTHLVCYCRDCRSFARHLGVDDQLEPGGGVPLIQTLPSRLEITRGLEHLACLRLSKKGLHRWYASCCNTPLANTLSSPKFPFVGLWRPLFEDISDFGPVQARGFTKLAEPGPGAPTKDMGLLTMLGGFLRRVVQSYLSGTARKTPFFDADGAPVVVPHVLSAEEFRAAQGR